ncbi:hypothetical protein N7488_010936 [Penicillium malachiteum]|nr:hypothetical protein N7488_010936 [Penicillium malachiteum]
MDTTEVLVDENDVLSFRRRCILCHEELLHYGMAEVDLIETPGQRASAREGSNEGQLSLKDSNRALQNIMGPELQLRWLPRCFSTLSLDYDWGIAGGQHA